MHTPPTADSVSTESRRCPPGLSIAPKLLAAAVIAVAGSVLVGWSFDIEQLKRFLPDTVAMNPMTAVCFMLLAVSLWLRQRPPTANRAARAAMYAAGLATLVGLMRLAGYLLSIEVWIDTALWPTKVLSPDPAGRVVMAPNTAACFVLSGVALLLFNVHTRRRRRLSEPLAVAVVTISILTLLGYFSRVSSLYAIASYIPMAIPTALCFLLCSIGLLLSPDAAPSGTDRAREWPVLTPGTSNGGSLERKISVGFTAALVIVIVMGAASYASLSKLLADSALNQHTQNVLVAIEELSGALKDAQLGSQGYMTTGVEDYLKPFRASREQVPPKLAELNALTRDNPRQQAQLERLAPLAHEMLQHLSQLIETRRTAGPKPARQIVRTGRGKRLMDRIVGVLRDMKREEESLLDVRTAASNQSTRATIVIVGLGSLAAIVVAVLARRRILRDIVRRNEIEAALQESERKYRFMADLMPQIVWVCRPNGGVEYFNSRGSEYTGLILADCAVDGWHQALHPDDLGPWLKQWQRCLDTGTPLEGELRLKRASDGAYRWFLCRGLPRCDEHGRIVDWVGTCTDIDDQKKNEGLLEASRTAAEDANRAKSEFLATMSHELRTPLNGVIGMTELLLGTPLSESQRRYAWLAKSSGDTLLTLINDILDFSKIEAGKLELESTDFDLRYALDSIATTLASRAAAKGLELTAALHPSVPTLVCGDPGRLQQVLMNLTTNAIKFTDRGEVTIRGALEEDATQHAVIRFEVSDTGIGIPPDRVGRLFQSFSQVDASTTRRYGGTGLGLAICRQLVELMGGQIGVSSELGKGSTFSFTVRLRKQSTGGAAVPSIGQALWQLRVLVVDDNATNREILGEQLTSWGLDHAQAPEADAALRMLREAAATTSPFGMAILDLNMPGMDGIRLANAIKQDESLGSTILILLGSVENGLSDDTLRAAGFAGYLTKPVRQSQLLDTLTDAVAGHGAVARSRESSHATHHAASASAPQTAPRGARILLAEDHEISQEVARNILARAGFVCDVAADGRQALAAVLARPYDLVLMDYQMPEMDGFEATRAIRQAEQEGRVRRTGIARLPIIALTANAVKGDRERCLEAGMDDYISKPLDPKRVVEVIQSHLAERQAPTSTVSPQVPATVNESPDDASPFRESALLEFWDGDVELAARRVAEFQERVPADVKQMQDCVASGNVQQAARAAHKLRGAAAYLAATSLCAAAARIEEHALAGDLARAAECLAELRCEVNRCLAYRPDELTTRARSTPKQSAPSSEEPHAHPDRG